MGYDSKMGDNSGKKQNTGNVFFVRNSFIKFQNFSIHSSKVVLCTKKQRDEMARNCKGPYLQNNSIKLVENLNR